MSEQNSLINHLPNPQDNNKAVWEPEISMSPTLFTLRNVIVDPQAFYSPHGLIQRALEEWVVIRRNEYLHDLLSGASHKDMFIFAALKPIVEKLNSVNTTDYTDNELDTLKENLDYFTGLQALGKKFLIIDGQHRLHEIIKYFQVKVHRPYTAPTVSKLSKHQKSLDRIKVANDDGVLETYPMNKKSFGELPESLRNELLDEIKITVSMISSGDIHELKGLFRKANSGTPLPFFVNLLSDSYGVTWRYMIEFCDEKKQNPNILNLENKFHGFANQYAPTSMGLAYTFSEMLLYLASDYGQDRTLRLDKDTKNSLEVLYDFEFSDLTLNMRKLHSKILKIIGNGMVLMKKKQKGIHRADFVDMFILTSMLLDNKHPSRPIKGGQKYNINDPEKFITALLKMLVILKHEDYYMHNEDTGEILEGVDPTTGNKFKIKNLDSYVRFQSTIWSATNVKHREGMMWNKFTTDFLATLEMQNVISKDGKAVTNQAFSRQAVAVKTNFADKYGKPLDLFDDVFGQNKSHDLGHIIAKSKGGDDSAENLEYEPISANRKKQNS